MPRISAGLLMYRIRESQLQVLFAHPGGPFFQNKDDGASHPFRIQRKVEADLLR